MNKSKNALVKSAITLLAVMFALGLAACPSDSPTEKTDGNDATLTSVKFNGADAALGTPSSTYDGITVPGSINLITGNKVTVAATARDSKASVLMDAVTGTEAPDFFYDNEYDFAAAGDSLAIEVTAADGKTKLYYRINVTVADVALESLTIDGKTSTPALPTAALVWQDAIAGSVLFDYPVDEQPTAGLTVVAITATEGATVEYGHAEGNAEPFFNATSTIKFKDGEYLYIKVTSASGSSAYYKVQVNFQMKGTIKYGSPQIADNVIDPLWDDPTLQVYPIAKPYPTDTSAGFIANPDTFAEAKALWDENGLYIYVKVIDSEVSEVDNEHESDSVELFINEAYPNTSYAQGGSQYRVGANGQRSGEGGSPAALNALNKTSAWKTDDGYIVIFQAPWRLRNRFPFANPYTNDRQIGFEIQLNVAPETGPRYAVIVWNNVAHTNYQNANDYGVATLDASDKSGPLVFPAVPPSIDTQPAGAIVSGGEPVTLSVAASVLPANGGTLSYQWYAAETSSGEGMAITGATSMTYTFNAPADEGRYYYFAIVTNTLNGTTAATRSASAAINVSNVVMVEQLTLSENFAVYSFTLPAGEEFGNYTSITVDYRMDADNFAKGERSIRLMGNYLIENFSLNGSYMHYAFDTANAAYIFDDIGTGAIDAIAKEELGLESGDEFPEDQTRATVLADKWFTLTYRLIDNNPHSGFVAANRPDDSDAGAGAGKDEPFLFGIGIPAWGNADDPTAAKTQLVRNITMVHKDNPAKNAAGTSTNMLVGYGDHRLTNSSREWVPEPDSGANILTEKALINPTPILLGNSNENGSREFDSDGLTVIFESMHSSANLGVTYDFPDDWEEYENVIIDYSIVIIDTDNNPGAKLTTKVGKTTAQDVVPVAGGQYRQWSEDTNGELAFTTKAFKATEVKEEVMAAGPGITFQVNTWLSEAGPNPMKFSFKVNKITFVPAE